MLSRGNHKETLPMRQGLTLHTLLPLQMSFFSYILFFIAGWLLLLLLSSNFHSTLPGMVLQEPLFACVWFFFFFNFLLIEVSSDGSPEILIARDILVPVDIWPADLKISFWNLSVLLCAWSVTHSHPSHPPLRVPDPTVNGWWVTASWEPWLSTLSSPSAQLGSNDSSSDSPRLQM